MKSVSPGQRFKKSGDLQNTGEGSAVIVLEDATISTQSRKTGLEQVMESELSFAHSQNGLV